MPVRLLTGILICLPTLLCAQYQGGSGNGYVRKAVRAPLSIPGYCFGGDNDGYSVKFIHSEILANNSCYFGGQGDGHGTLRSATSINQQQYVFGGAGDGFVQVRKDMTLNQQHYALGGAGDGFVKVRKDMTLNQQHYVFGGAGDGFVKARNDMSLNQHQYVYGGAGDGHDRLLFQALLGPGIWEGLVSTDWTNASNWLCNMVPDVSIPVTVPAGCDHYPSLGGNLSVNSTTGSYTCKSINILSGGAVSNTGGLSVSGAMTVKGNYTSYCSINHSQNILSGGSLSVISPGIVRLGAQTSGPATTDLIVHSGGTILQSGGTLEIDDQLNLLGGSVIVMDSGLLSLNHYGMGSDYSSSDPGAFYAGSGASGTFSGGTVRICGKNTIGAFPAINIESTVFSFSDTSVIEITHGISTEHFDAGIKTANGISFGNLIINKPGHSVHFISDLIIKTSLTINPGAWLVIDDGADVTAGDTGSLLNQVFKDFYNSTSQVKRQADQ